MATSWLGLQKEIKSGISLYAEPVAGSCTTGAPSGNPAEDIDFPDITEEIQGFTDTLTDIQSEIDQFGSEVMGVLQDIGAWIPPELSGQGISSTSSTSKPNPGGETTTTPNVFQSNLNAGVAQVDGYDPETGGSFWGIIKGDGSHVILDEMGNFRVKAVSLPNDPKTGDIRLWSMGSTVVKSEQTMLVEVGNNGKIFAKDAASGKSIAISLKAYGGNLEISVENADIALSGKNISLRATDTLDLHGANINIHAAPSPSVNPDKKGSEDCGGSLDVRCGNYNLEYATKKGVQLADYTKSDGEVAFVMSNSAGNFGITSSGSLSIKTGGDMLERIGGRKMTTVFDADVTNITSKLALPLITGVSAGYYIINKQKIPPAIGSGVASGFVAPLVEIDSPISAGGHGFKVSAGSGDIDMMTKTGNYILGNDSSALAGVVKTDSTIKSKSPILKQIKTPGTYLSSLKEKININSKLEILLRQGALSSSPPSPGTGSYIKVAAARLEISNKTGIFLN